MPANATAGDNALYVPVNVCEIATYMISYDEIRDYLQRAQ